MITDETVSAVELGRILGISGRAVREHSLNGVLTKDARGRYPFPGAVVQYCEHYRKIAAGRGGTGAVASTTAQRARLIAAQADAVEAKNARERGSLLDAAAVERGWCDLVRQSRAAVLAVPSRCQQRLPHLTLHDVSEIDHELREALRELGGADGTA
jgi:terminase small subunit / prophage DNA-packing protein